MAYHKLFASAASLALAFGLAACGNTDVTVDPETQDKPVETSESSEQHGDHEGMDHSGSSEIPAGLMEAESPTYEPGSNVIVNADHMDGMEGAEATISGAYDTTVYAVTYTPTDGGDVIENHKWVIHEELKDSGSAPLEPGDTVTLNTDHMSGMQDAEAEIVSAEDTTVYMIDYESPDGEKITNHKWVTEEELSAP